jgi:hypothetical protein
LSQESFCSFLKKHHVDGDCGSDRKCFEYRAF